MKATLSTARLRIVSQSVQERFEGTTAAPYFNHTLRVANYAGRIASSEGLDAEVLTAAALVHDIGMSVDPSYMGHPAVTAEIAPAILIEAGFPVDDARRIADVACSHHPAPDDVLDDLAKRIVFDADWLDLVGILGFMRWYGRIPENLADLAGSARLFTSIVAAAHEKRGGFFYTDLANQLGSEALEESMALSRTLAAFVGDAIEDSPDLRPAGFLSSITGSQE